jgi:hypothetical protein
LRYWGGRDKGEGGFETVFNDKKFMKNIVKERKDNASKAEDDVVDEEPPSSDPAAERATLREAPLSLAINIPGGEAIKILALSLAVRR